MGKRFHSTVYNVDKSNSVAYTIEVYDTSFGGVSTEFSTEFCSLQYDGTESNRNNTILAASLSFGMLIKNATLEAFLDDLIPASEGRFRIMLKVSSTIKFVGYVVTDLVEIENVSFPYTFKITAVDGIARLKNINYTDSGSPYSGYNTITEHLNNIISHIGLDDLAGSTLTTEIGWVEDNMGAGDTLDLTRFNHSVFTKKDNNGNDQFTNCFVILNEICKTFLARFLYFDGAYHFQQVNEYETLSTYDKSNDKALAGGIWRMFPALKEVRSIFKHSEQKNHNQGLSLNSSNTSGEINVDYKSGTELAISGQIQYRSVFTTSYLVANSGVIPPHRVKFNLGIKIFKTNLTTEFIKRTSTSADFYIISDSEMSWTFISTDNFEIYGEIIEGTLYNSNHIININFVTPGISGDIDRVLITLTDVHVLLPDGTTVDPADVDVNWSFFNGSFKDSKAGENETINYEKIYTATNDNTGNSESINILTKLGDIDLESSLNRIQIYDGAAWINASQWTKDRFSALNSTQLLSNEMLAGQTRNIRLLDNIQIMHDFSPLQRLTYKTIVYLFLRGTWNFSRDEIDGEWIQIDINRSEVTAGAVITGDGSTNTNPTGTGDGSTTTITEIISAPTDNNLKNVQSTLLDCLSIIRLDQDLDSGTLYTSFTIEPVPAQIIFYENDVLKIIHPVTGYSESISVAANTGASNESKYTSGDTTLYATYTPAKNFPDGSFILKDLKNSPKQEIQYNTFEGVTAGFVDVDFNLPDTTDEINKRVLIFREFAASQNSKDFTIGPDGGGLNRRVTFFPALNNENVIIKLLPEI